MAGESQGMVDHVVVGLQNAKTLGEFVKNLFLALGVMQGLEAMLWAFILAGGVALIRLVWKIGAAQILQNVVKYMWTLARYRTRLRLNEEERKPLKTSLCLSPSALAAVCVVKWEWFASWIET